MCSVQDIVTGRQREVQITRMRPYVDASLDNARDLQDALNLLQNQGEFEMKAILNVALAADLDDCVVQIKSVGFEKEKTSWWPVIIIHADAPKNRKEQLKKCKLPKSTHEP